MLGSRTERFTAPDPAGSFAVVAEGEGFEEAKAKAAHAGLDACPHRVGEGYEETPETLRGGGKGAYAVAAFPGDLRVHAVDAAEFVLIA
ncbi:hypothetical protein SNE510_75570 [Streptomyces sp. NE5-10]|uniref:hypothetical protein n=1 Tax=Streptomyces sp. NE5-10 TaxID=2759674 RepID=UPI001905E330|nr:hypothetical protein [Streptomyces sp. NE5-10]GHJ98038.1 hypothetical protein SNE510_75570 [Streptomyces sp. NE5-10]